MQRLQNLSQTIGLLAGVLVVSLTNITPSHAKTVNAPVETENELLDENSIAESPADSNEEVAAVVDTGNEENEASLIIEDDENNIETLVTDVSDQEFLSLTNSEDFSADTSADEVVTTAQNSNENETNLANLTLESDKLPPASDAQEHSGEENFEIASAIDEMDLDNSRGAGLSSSYAYGTVYGNTSQGDTGTNNLSDSFKGATGFTSVIQNTGNGVVIQDSTIINISILQ